MMSQINPNDPPQEPPPTGAAQDFWRRYSQGEEEADTPRDGTPAHECLDWCPICRGAELMRATVPPELQEQFQVVQRDVLLMVQAMIQSHLERLRNEAPADADPPVEDIPIQ